MDSEDPKTRLGYMVPMIIWLYGILDMRDSGWVIQFSFHEF